MSELLTNFIEVYTDKIKADAHRNPFFFSLVDLKFIFRLYLAGFFFIIIKVAGNLCNIILEFHILIIKKCFKACIFSIYFADMQRLVPKFLFTSHWCLWPNSALKKTDISLAVFLSRNENRSWYKSFKASRCRKQRVCLSYVRSPIVCLSAHICRMWELPSYVWVYIFVVFQFECITCSSCTEKIATSEAL